MTVHVPLAELAAEGGFVGGPFGSNLVSDDYRPAGVPVIRGANMGADGRLHGPFVYVSPEKFESDLARNTASPGDLVFTQRGTLGQVVRLDEGSGTFVISQSQMRLRLDPRKADSRYVLYACRMREFRHLIELVAIRTGVPHINLGILKELAVPIVPLALQQGIAEVLGVLDDKVAANRRVIAAADTLRGALWLRLCRNSKPRPLSEIARFVNGRAFTKDATGTGRVVVRIAELNSGLSGSTVRHDLDVAEDHLARPGDFLMAWSGSLTAARWFRDEAIVNQHIFKVIPTGNRSLWSVACAVDSKMEDFKHEAAGKATTMGHIQRRHLDEPVLWPVLTDEDESRGRALWDRALLAERESEVLARTRDELLPLLMSGKITVKDAEKRVEGVV